MPGKDKTGPMGKGKATGRGLGNCEVTDGQQQKPGCGRNQGSARGRGLGR